MFKAWIEDLVEVSLQGDWNSIKDPLQRRGDWYLQHCPLFKLGFYHSNKYMHFAYYLD